MANHLQRSFFQRIKETIPSHLSLADELAECLNISLDSAYRRMRGEKPIDFEELAKLAVHFKISLDQFLHLSSDSILFTDRSLQTTGQQQFDLYLKALIQDLSHMNSFEQKKMYYLNKDVPIFYHFMYPELAAFKCFFWMRSITHDPAYAKEKFSLDKYMNAFTDESRKISHLYASIPSIEIWNIESINSTIRQIEYYKDTHVFAYQKEIKPIYESLIKVIDRIEQSAEVGQKLLEQKGAIHAGASYEVYVNEFILGDNTILVQLDETKAVYLNHAVHNYMLTTEPRFCAFTEEHLQNIIKRSVPLSRVNEKERTRFFNRNREKVYNRLEALRL